MDKGREKEAFVTFKIKATTAQKFRTFCKNNAASQSMSLLQMIQFFEFNGIAPTDNLGDSIAKLEGKINKRTNAIIAIIKDIEKHQTQPTTSMTRPTPSRRQFLKSATAGIGAASANALDARVSFITTYGNHVTRNRRRLWKLTGVTEA